MGLKFSVSIFRK